jgi:AraC-like DNA-binding protein
MSLPTEEPPGGRFLTTCRQQGDAFSMTRKDRRRTPEPPIGRTVPASAVEQRMMAMIDSGAAFNIGDLAARLHVSPAQLQRLFKRETGSRMGEWLIAQRLHKAAYLLANSYLSVKEIARSAGYEHVSSFIRAFERRYALTPKRYREAAAAKGADSGGSVA